MNTSRSRTKTFLKEDDEDDLNEGFCLYSVIDDSYRKLLLGLSQGINLNEVFLPLTICFLFNWL